ncbi:MAG: lipopolysaccharide biosynthesis protein [Erysipelotrichaceae bacterium]|nr:lipopolysaccharide biosynthesis protein [Erysipelotrichaceae bacterium]
MRSKSVVSNLIWRFAERCGAQGVSFIVSVVLARLLAPDAYGTVALVTAFTAILQVFVDSGMGNALIQKKTVDDLDFSSVFFFNFLICIILYLGMFIAAPFIADFYNMPELTLLVRVISLTLVISGIKNVQQAYVSRNLLFKKFFYATIGGTIFSAILGIAIAYMGFGVWALVVQQLSNAIIDTLILWLTVKWRPKWMFSFRRLKGLFAYGWKLLASALLDTIYNNVRQLIIGKFYSASDLAFYNKGKQFPNLIVTNINTSIDSVLLPVMSQEQDNRTRVKAMTRKAIRTSSYIMWPLMFGLAIVAEPLISLVLTEKWLPCVPYLRIFCFTYALWPIHTANLNAIKAMGRSDMFLKLEIIKKVMGVISIVLTLPFGVFAIALGYMATGPLSAAVNAFPNKKLLQYSFKEQILDLLPFFLMSCFMAILIWPIQYLALPKIAIITLQVFCGGIIYIAESKVLHIDVFDECLGMVRKIVKKQ